MRLEDSLTPAPRIHVAVIMDGNGRWARARGLPREAGHSAGADAVRRTVEAARSLDIGWLTLFAFSSDNWQRPRREVSSLLDLFAGYLEREAETCASHDIRLRLIGRRDRLGASLLALVERAEEATRHGAAMHLRLAIDYSGREAILRAAKQLAALGDVSPETFSRLVAEAPDVDLLIRTGGEQRLSDFLLWESAYAELVFTRRMWPDFERADLEAALREFQARERRFGRIRDAAAG